MGVRTVARMSSTAAPPRIGQFCPAGDTVRRAGLVVRVSTLRDAEKDEGSLTNQLARIRAHLQYKTVACGERWEEVAVYELKGISGKTSLRSAELTRLNEDIISGRINTVVCNELSRVSRNVRD